ncbi:MAG: carboxypeptidase-like regulatory domain-containing protein [Prolixibacteraceae bacterium]|nr:carboxypeptidase-like regulatory domain-containing protein [Prolixibacteraceae bacterium]
MKKIFLAILATTMFLASYAEKNTESKSSEAEKETAVQTIDFTGSIIDQVSSEALVGVEVQIEGTDIKTYTDFDGNFKFENLKPGKYNVVASYISYEKSKLENIEVSQANSDLKIELETTK